MPLRKRLESELCSEWGEQALPYKQLQHEAEELVGNDDAESEAVFLNHAICAIEKASSFYELKVKELMGVFREVSISVGGVHDVHKDREKCTTLTNMVSMSSPSTSTEHLWAMTEELTAPDSGIDDEDRSMMRKCFEIWSEDARYKPGRRSLASFVSNSFLLTLEESALRDALREFLQMLVYIDRIRNFTLLNCVVAMKLAQCHCSTKLEARLTDALHASPMFQMTELNEMVPQIEDLAGKLHEKLSGETSPRGLPREWSLHVCPFCSHTTTNTVLLPNGRTCCWKCAAESASNAIVYCPLTDKPMTIKEIRIERTLVSFLRRFFPGALKDAPARLIGAVEEAEEKPVASSMGMMGMLSALKTKTSPKQLKTKPAVGRRQQRILDELRPPSFELEKLNVEVSSILKGLAGPASPGQSKARCLDSPSLLPLRRRERSISMPCEPPNLHDLFLGAPSLVDTSDQPAERVLVPRNARGFPLYVSVW